VQETFMNKHPQPSLVLRRAAARGHTDFGWLNSWHTFSFGEYADPGHMGFRALRVINDDRVAEGEGFPTHPHRDMEIFSYVLSGGLAHRDSLGNERVLRPGQIQVMGAGTGVTHSEYNPSEDEPVHFLQVWILPRQRGLPPVYSEWQPDAARADEPKTLVISADGRDGSAVIRQDVSVYRIRLQAGNRAEHELAAGHGMWLQVMRGKLVLNGVDLVAGDGASTEEAGSLVITAHEAVEALLFDLI
jgi:redox-sensitive bicupin YhaK (pirin superfamily)